MRTIWKGAISFGLIHIPVRLYTASHSRELTFKLLHKKDLSEIRYARICKEETKEVPWDEIVKGYEIEEGNFVVLSDEDFQKANVKKSKTIEILDFAFEEEIDPIFYETPYYLEPEKGAAKAYNLLREALRESGKVAVGHFVFKQHEHLGVIRPHGDLLILNQLRYVSELVNPAQLNIPKEGKISKQEMEMALKLIDQLTHPFQPDRYSDTYTEDLKALIAKKSKGKKSVVKEKPEKPAKIHDIMTLLKQSLHEGEKKPKKKSTKKPSPRKTKRAA